MFSEVSGYRYLAQGFALYLCRRVVVAGHSALVEIPERLESPVKIFALTRQVGWQLPISGCVISILGSAALSEPAATVEFVDLLGIPLVHRERSAADSQPQGTSP